MKYKAVRVEDGLNRPFRFSQHPVRDFRSCIELSFNPRFRLEDGKFVFHDFGAVRTADVTYDLLAAATKTKFVVFSIASHLFAHKSLVSQFLQIAYH